MMCCPRCNKSLRIEEERENLLMREIYRRRVCTVCKKEVFTIEFEVEDNPKFRETWEHLNH